MTTIPTTALIIGSIIFFMFGGMIGEEYYRLANERLQAAQQQLTLPI